MASHDQPFAVIAPAAAHALRRKTAKKPLLEARDGGSTAAAQFN